PQSRLTDPSDSVAQFIPGPPALVYKTRGDYYHLVPVLLSEDKKEIISYPHPKDLIRGHGYTLPDSLNNGYWLDNRGIGANVAFLDLTYEEYANLKEVPTPEQLYGKIVDFDPLTELCNCGLKASFQDPVKEINMLIDSGELREKCRAVK
ncbi:MAG: hypothetical protein PHD61_09865, partial [Bacteroidales bacterium]|nr:hypothetical protein [Bacteroidales bacterium]